MRREALARPHDPTERMDPDYQVAMRCKACGKVGHGPRAQIRDAMREHMDTDCTGRGRNPDAPQVMELLYPRL